MIRNIIEISRMKLLSQQIIIGFLSLSLSAFGQSDQIRFDHITSENGLSENVINCIFQDSQGFMWFGTDDGLNRFDGYDFTVYKPSPDDSTTINSNLIFGVTEDGNGALWIGTTGSGLNRFDPATETFTSFQHNPDEQDGLSHDHIVDLMVDHQGRVWIGTFDGLNLLDPGKSISDEPTIQKINIPDVEYPLSIFDIIEDESDNIWLGTNQGLFKGIFKSQTNNFRFKKIEIDHFENLFVRGLAMDRKNRLIIVSNNGLLYQNQWGGDITFDRIVSLPNQESIIIENENRIWVGSNNGLLCYKPNQNESYQLDEIFNSNPSDSYSLNNNVIKCLYQDNTGVIWIGTNGGGINRFDPSRKQFYHFGTNFSRNGNLYKKIRSVLKDSDGHIWIGTEGGGLFFQNCINQECEDYGDFLRVGEASNVFALQEVYENGERYIYAGSPGYPFLQKFRVTSAGEIISEQLNDIPGSVFSILQDIDSSIWIGTYNNGLSRWIPRKGGFEKKTFLKDATNKNGLNSNIIRKLYEDTKGNIWIGTSNGLSFVKPEETKAENPTFHTFLNTPNDTNSLSHNYILDIYESSTGEMWIGTFGEGLNCLIAFDEYDNARFKRFTKKNGLPNNSVKCIQEDNKGNLWLASNSGLSKFNPRKGTFQNFTISDGLQANEFLEGASFKTKHGTLIFGGVNGFNVFNPSDIKIHHTIPVVRFTKLLVHNQEVKPNQKINGKVVFTESISTCKSITLKYKQNDFSIEFAALHYAAPDKNKYAYKLVGYHDDWVMADSDKRFATFTQLPHGNYTLFVKASNGDNVWSNEPISLNIKINPPFWLTWYAYLVYALFISFALWLFRRYTIISVQEKHRLTLEHIEREKLEELNQMKLRFFTNISHELRTPLTLIIAPLENILEKRKLFTPEKLQQQYHYMYKNAKYLLRLVNQLLDFRKLDRGSQNLRVGKGNIADFIRETTEPFQFLANKKDIAFEVINSESHVYTYYDPDVIEKVVYNLLSNAFKFTPTGGKVTVQILEKETVEIPFQGQYIEIRVQDNGPGISKRKVKKIFERFYKESSKKENKDGAGIGLAYTKSLVELHHGLISVETKVGEGACFIVQLPQGKKNYLKSELDQFYLEHFEATSDPFEYLIEESSVKVASAPSKLNLDDGEEKLPLLLFIDDNSDIRQFIREGFHNDFRIIEAEDGEKGYEVALSSLPDIIVSDIMMPNMTGIELCKAIKTNTQTSHIPIVLLTAKSAKEDEKVGFETGADAYVVKPFKLDILRAQLKSIYLQREKLREIFRREVILEPKKITVTSADEDFLTKAMSIIEEHMSNSDFNVEALTKEMHLSRSKLYLKLKALTGLSCSEFIRSVRLKRALQLLEKSDYTIKEIMYQTGFNTASYFSSCFKKQFGVVPSEYLRKQKSLQN